MSDAGTVEASPYAGTRVAVLGANGFVGRWVARAVARAGAEPTLVVRSRGRAAPVFDAMGIGGLVVEADLGDPDQAGPLLTEIAPAVTFNLIGYGVDPAENDAETSERINSGLARSVAEACTVVADPGWPGQRLVHVGSALEYGTAGGDLAEDTRCTPTTVYGQTKLAGSLAIADVSGRRGLAAVTARLFTVYGPGEHHGRLLPSLLAVAETGRPLELTEGEQRRDFTFVEDVADGLLRLGTAEPQAGGIVNLATGRLSSVRAFVETAARVLSIPSDLLRFGALPGRPSEMRHEDVSIAKLEGLTGWHPPTEVPAGIAATAEYERAMGRWPSG